MFLVNDKLVWRDKTVTRPPGTMVHMHKMFFAIFTNLKSSFSEDNMSEHALDIFIENATKKFSIIPLNAKIRIKL